jgi:two-component system, OmpR family, KDP operon response regulator KdpE
MIKENIKVLVVDDEFSIRQAVRTALNARSGEDAIETIATFLPNVVLLDYNLGGINGSDVCRQVRLHFPAVGIIMLTVRDSQRDKIEALDAGADDYVVKPFTVGEVAARIRAVYRRYPKEPSDQASPIVIGDVEVDSARRSVRKAGAHIHLTPKEFEVLHYLIQRPGVPVPYTQLLKAVWGPQHVNQVEYVRTFMNQLRKKIELDPSHPVYLITQPYVGYPENPGTRRSITGKIRHFNSSHSKL